jgi:MFS transporter, ACS family, hexuronate transporter
MKMSSVKWLVVALLSVSTLLNYIDRQTLALLSKPIQAALHIDDKGYAFIVTVFMFAYMAGNFFSSWLIDRVGARLTLAWLVILWSLVGIGSGLVQTGNQLAVARFFLGFAEVGNWVAAISLVNAFFPPSQRAFAIGTYTAAAMFGAAISPPLITWINEWTGWRTTFVLTGGVGILWAVCWLVTIKPISSDEGYADNLPFQAEDDADVPKWSDALRSTRVWALALGIMLTWPVWYFYLNWFPKYLIDERGLSTLQMGHQAWVVYLAAGIGCLSGGALTGLLMKTGMNAFRAKLWVLGGVCVLAPIGAINAFEPAVRVSLAVGAAVAFIHMYWQTNLTALITDLFTSRSFGRVSAVTGIAAGLGGMGTTWLIGQMVSIVSYRPMFVVMAVVYPVAMVVIVWLTRGSRPGVVASVGEQT